MEGGEVREAGEKGVGSGSSKMAGCGRGMQNPTRCHLVCIRIPKEQEREVIFDLHQRLLSNQAKKKIAPGLKNRLTSSEIVNPFTVVRS